ncbi:MAG TPA: hypothetical protein PKY51_04520 [Fimbriimonadaceae bacterium]|nr:hypothetical protein [Fimbriimonadaceae bacterium]
MGKTKGAIYMIGAKGMGVLLMLLATRVYVQRLGYDQFGIFVFLQLIATSMMLIDFGFTVGAQKKMTELIAADDRDSAHRVFRSLLFVNFVTGLVGLALTTALALVIRLPGVDLDTSTRLSLFCAAGLQFLATMIVNTGYIGNTAFERFDRFALISAAQSGLIAVFGITAVIAFQTLQAVVWSWAIASLLLAAYSLFTIRQTTGRWLVMGQYHAGDTREMRGLGMKSYWHRLSQHLADSLDRMLLSFKFGPAPVGRYDASVKLGNTLYDVLAGMNTTTLPEMTRATTDETRFGNLIKRNALVAATVATSCILIPAGFGDALLKIWLGADHVPEGALWICLLMAFYKAIYYIITSLATSTYAVGRPDRMVPFAIFNAAVTLILTIPAYRAGGLIGVAVMNACINGGQLLPLVWVIKRKVAPGLDVTDLLSRLLMILVLGAGLSVVGVFLCQTAWIQEEPLLALLLMPVLVGVQILAAFGLKWSPVPGGLDSKLQRVLGRLGLREEELADQQSAAEIQEKVDAHTQARGQASLRKRWIGLLVVWAFAAGVLLMGLIPVYRAQHSDPLRNDGKESSVFVFHGEPYGVFVEDYHLYTVRAQRIQDRGWTSSPFASVPEEKSSYASPVQVFLGQLAARTDGQVGPYSVLLFAILALTWGFLYWVAVTWLPPGVSRKGILLAILITVLFQYATNVRDVVVDLKAGLMGTDPMLTSLWPMDRALRLATNSWSSPLLLSALIILSSMLFWGGPRRKGLVLFGVLMLLLLGGDTWAFGLGFMTGFLAFAAYAWQKYRQKCSGRRDWVFVGLGLGFLVLCFVGQRVLSGAVAGDALVRGGFGAAWIGSPDGTPLSEIARFGRNLLPILIVIFAIAAARRFHGPFRSIVLLGAYPTVAFFLVQLLFWRTGVQLTQATQVFWRSGYVLLFVFFLLLFEVIRQGFMAAAIQKGRDPGAFRKPLTAAWLSGLLCLGLYHYSRIFRYISGPEARELAITRDLEGLRGWIRALPDRGAGKSMATLGMEINHHVAFWSRSDLALPVGFPLHNNQSNDAIITRLVDVLRFYNVQPNQFDAFILREAPANQNSWKTGGRLLAERQGYLFFLLHMEAFLRGREKTQQGAPEMDAILSKLREFRPNAAPPIQPDIVIIDEVSRAMGATPDLSDYKIGYSGRQIEAWIKRADAP